MNQPIKWVENQMPKSSDSQLKVMDLEEVKKARAFHKSFPQYSKTPLRKLENMAQRLGELIDEENSKLTGVMKSDKERLKAAKRAAKKAAEEISQEGT